MVPFEALYGHVYRTPVYWNEVGERAITWPELVEQSIETIKIIRERLKITQNRQKSYADKRRRSLEFQVGDSSKPRGLRATQSSYTKAHHNAE